MQGVSRTGATSRPSSSPRPQPEEESERRAESPGRRPTGEKTGRRRKDHVNGTKGRHWRRPQQRGGLVIGKPRTRWRRERPGSATGRLGNHRDREHKTGARRRTGERTRSWERAGNVTEVPGTSRVQAELAATSEGNGPTTEGRV